MNTEYDVLLITDEHVNKYTEERKQRTEREQKTEESEKGEAKHFAVTPVRRVNGPMVTIGSEVHWLPLPSQSSHRHVH